MNNQFGRGNQMFLYESLLYFLIKGHSPRIKRKKKPWRRWKKLLAKNTIMGENAIHVSPSSYLIQSPHWTLRYFPHSTLKPWAWDPHTQLWDEITGWTQQVSSRCRPSHMATMNGKHGGELLALPGRPYCPTAWTTVSTQLHYLQTRNSCECAHSV